MQEYTTIHVDYVAALSGQVRSVIEKRGVCSIFFSIILFSIKSGMMGESLAPMHIP